MNRRFTAVSLLGTITLAVSVHAAPISMDFATDIGLWSSESPDLGGGASWNATEGATAPGCLAIVDTGAPGNDSSTASKYTVSDLRGWPGSPITYSISAKKTGEGTAKVMLNLMVHDANWGANEWIGLPFQSEITSSTWEQVQGTINDLKTCTNPWDETVTFQQKVSEFCTANSKVEEGLFYFLFMEAKAENCTLYIDDFNLNVPEAASGIAPRSSKSAFIPRLAPQQSANVYTLTGRVRAVSNGARNPGSVFILDRNGISGRADQRLIVR
jgi:hypothetical protein